MYVNDNTKKIKLNAKGDNDERTKQRIQQLLVLLVTLQFSWTNALTSPPSLIGHQSHNPQYYVTHPKTRFPGCMHRCGSLRRQQHPKIGCTEDDFRSSSSNSMTTSTAKNNNNNNNNNHDDDGDLSTTTPWNVMETEREQLVASRQLLDLINRLEDTIRNHHHEQDMTTLTSSLCSSTSTTTADDMENHPDHHNNNNEDIDQFNHWQRKVQELEDQVNWLLLLRLLPPPGLDQSSYRQAIRWYLQLPLGMRWAICYALELSEPSVVAIDWTQAPSIVTQLYKISIQIQQQQQQQPKEPTNDDFISRWKLALASCNNQFHWKRNKMQNKQMLAPENDIISRQQQPTTDEALPVSKSTLFGKSFPSLFSRNDISNITTTTMEMKEPIVSGFNRVTRKSDVTTQDLQMLLSILKSEKLFTVSQTEKVQGGYILRGKNQKSNGADLIRNIDDSFQRQQSMLSSSSSWSAQVCYIPDYPFVSELKQTDDSLDILEPSDPVLLVVNKDFTPGTKSFTSVLSTLAALSTMLFFGFDVFNANELVARRLADAGAINDFSNGIDWFNGMFFGDLILPILIIQVAHEVGHLLVGWQYQIRTGFPTLLPLWKIPFLGAWTPILNSPKNLTSLFDFAMIGPVMGLMTSTIFFMVGLRATSMATPDMAQYFPALPVSFLQLSTLCGTVVDYWLGGGHGYVLLQDPTTLVPLHPFVIVGFCGLIMSALELIPLRNSDGGRVSQALFGRFAHVVMSTWLLVAILIATLLQSSRNEILLGFILWSSLTRSDLEVPCRDETARVDLLRGAAAMAMWILAVLILTPIGTR